MDDSVRVSTQTQVHDRNHAFVHHGRGGSSDNDNGNDDGIVGNTSSNLHREAEKRRRDRINAHLTTLRKLVSNSDYKIDKATLLGKVVQHLKQLKSETKETTSNIHTVPPHYDEVTINDVDLSALDPDNEAVFMIKACVCCEDRPQVFAEIKQALKSLSLTLVQADITCLCGRIVCNFILCVTNNNVPGEVDELARVKESLKMLLGRIVSSTGVSHYRIRSKRQRFFCSSSYGSQ